MSKPVSALDVASYILNVRGEMSAMKLQKLVYYSQAWSLVWDDEPIFSEEIQAWREGPVVKVLWDKHKGKFQVGRGDIPGDAEKLNKEQRKTVDSVVRTYGEYDGLTLSKMSHDESPWKQARLGLDDGESSSAPITHESMKAFYSSL